MEKELNIAAILKDKPRNTKLYSLVYGKCKLNKVGVYGMFSVICDGAIRDIKENGKIFDAGECTIYPSKQMQDWSKFAWKKGDVLQNRCGSTVIFSNWSNDDYTKFDSCYARDIKGFFDLTYQDTNEFHKASDKDAKAFIKKIEDYYCGKLNLKTFEIEKTKPEFKDGDIVAYGSSVAICRKIYDHTLYFYASLEESLGLMFDHNNISYDVPYRLATDSEKQKLFAALAKENKAWDADKKQLVDLPKKCEFKPMEPMDLCLMRDFGETWKLCQFGFMEEVYAKDNAPYNAVGGNWYNECIPYNDHTAHLLGTTDDWKGGEE